MNQQENYQHRARTDSNQYLKLTTSRNNVIVLMDEVIKGYIVTLLLHYRYHTPIAGMDYTIEGPDFSESGTTDENGMINYREILAGYYTLTAGESTFQLVTTEDEDDCQIVLYAPAEEESVSDEHDDWEFIPIDEEDEEDEDNIPEYNNEELSDTETEEWTSEETDEGGQVDEEVDDQTFYGETANEADDVGTSQ